MRALHDGILFGGWLCVKYRVAQRSAVRVVRKHRVLTCTFVRLLEAHLPYCLKEAFSEFRRQGVPGSSLPTERCCVPTAGAVGSGRGKRVRKRSIIASSPSILTFPELNASPSWGPS
jgi:hypothetical protein